MSLDHSSEHQSNVQASFILDAASLILIIVSLYLAFRPAQHFWACPVFLGAGLMGLSLRRRGHPSPGVARIARYVCTYAPTGAVFTLVAAALSDFGRHFTRVDFGMFYASGLQLRTDPINLYDVAAQNRMLEFVTGGLKNHFLPFPYPPFVAALFIPLSYLSFPAAYYVMLGGNAILLVAVVYMLCKSLCKNRDQVLAVVLAASVLLPIYINLILGQMAFAGLILYSLFTIDLLRNRTGRAGLWVALLSYKIMLVPIPLFVLLFRRAWRGILVTMSGCALLTALSVALVGTNGMLGNLHLLKMMTDESLIPRMQSLRGLTYYLGLPSAIYWLLSAALLGALWAIDRRGGDLRWLLASAVLANLLVSPYVQTYDLSLGLVALVLAVSSFSRVPDSKRTAIMLMTFLPGFISVAGQVTGKNWPATPLVVLLLFCYCLYRAMDERAVVQNR